MTNELFLTIVKAVLTIVISLVSAYLVPMLKVWLKNKLTDSQRKALNDAVKRAVEAAEKYYSPEEWEEKKKFVTNYILSIVNEYFMLTLTDEDIDVMIEGIVYEVKR